MIGRNAIAALASALLCMAAIGVQAQQPSPRRQIQSRALSGLVGTDAFHRNRRATATTRPSARPRPAGSVDGGSIMAIFDAASRTRPPAARAATRPSHARRAACRARWPATRGSNSSSPPKATHVIFAQAMPRRIYTDGRDRPTDVEPTLTATRSQMDR